MGGDVRPFVLLALLLTAAPLVGAPAPFAKTERPDRRSDLEKMQGTWVVVSALRLPDGGASQVGTKVVVSGDQMSWLDPRLACPLEDHLRLYASDSVNAIDFVSVESGELRKGIYFLRGDLLAIAPAAAGDERPSTFSRPSAVILRRNKP